MTIDSSSRTVPLIVKRARCACPAMANKRRKRTRMTPKTIMAMIVILTAVTTNLMIAMILTNVNAFAKHVARNAS